MDDTSETGLFERYLTVWVFLCIIFGITLGNIFDVQFQALGAWEIAQVNLPVAVPWYELRVGVDA